MASTLLDTPHAAPKSLPQRSDDPRKRWTRAEYRHLIETGVLEDGQYELVLGEIWKKQDKGRKHIFVVMSLLRILGATFGFYHVQSQTSLPVGDDDPEPDAAVLVQTLYQYLDTDPTESDTLLVAEASDSTLHSDLTRKVQQYGSVGIPEYWVVDIPNQLLHIFRQPIATGYAEEIVLTRDDEVRPLAAPNAAVRVADLLP